MVERHAEKPAREARGVVNLAPAPPAPFLSGRNPLTGLLLSGGFPPFSARHVAHKRCMFARAASYTNPGKRALPNEICESMKNRRAFLETAGR
jgi:hypothetical protein